MPMSLYTVISFQNFEMKSNLQSTIWHLLILRFQIPVRGKHFVFKALYLALSLVKAEVRENIIYLFSKGQFTEFLKFPLKERNLIHYMKACLSLKCIIERCVYRALPQSTPCNIPIF